MREGYSAGAQQVIKGNWYVFKDKTGFKVGFGNRVRFWKDK